MKKILIITMIFILITITTVQAVTINDIHISDEWPVSTSGWISIFDLGDQYFVIAHYGTFGSYSYNTTSNKLVFSNGPATYSYVDKTTGVWNTSEDTATNYTFTSIEDCQNKIVGSTQAISNTNIKANFSPVLQLKHNSKVQVTNSANTILKSEIDFTLSKVAAGNILITDSNGKFIEQIDITIDTGTSIKLKVLPGETRNIYFSFLPAYTDTIINYNIFSKPWFNVKKYSPKYEIIGQAFYQINGLDDTSQIPYIKPNVKTLFLMRYQDGTTYKTEPITLEANVKYMFSQGKKYVLQFQHPSNSSILVESNFNISTSADVFQPLDASVMESLINEVYGSGEIPIVQSQDKIVITTPTKAVKITRLGEDIVTQSLEVYTTASSETSGKVEWFSSVDGLLRKIRDRAITSTFAGMKKQVLIMQGEYCVFSNTSGNIQVTIPSKWKEGIDYSVEYITNYAVDPTVESDYRSTNPIMPDIASTNDVYTRTVDSSVYDWVQQTQGTGSSTDIMNTMKQTTETLTMFINPVKEFFTSMPELYGLIVLTFGLSIVLFVLGR